MKWFCLYISFLLFSCHALYAQSATEIVENYLTAVSGNDVKNWEKIKSAYIERSVDFNDTGHSGHSMNLLVKHPSRHVQYRVWPDMSLTEIYEDLQLKSRMYNVKGNRVFVLSGMSPVKTGSAGPYEPYFEFEPIVVQHAIAKSKSIKLRDTKVVNDIECFDVEVITKDLQWHFYFNTSNFLLEFWANSTDGNFATLTKVFDYKKNGNLLIPMSETKMKDNIVFYSSHINKIELNKNISLDLFQIPIE